MSPDLLFSICNNAIVLPWLLLVVLPRSKWVTRLICPVVIPMLLAVVYAALLISQIGQMDGGFTSLSGVESLLDNRYAMVGAWIHYLAFDLFIGSWEVRDSRRLGLPHILVIPCLLLTFLFGPMGLLLYFVVRQIKDRSFFIGIDEAEGNLSVETARL